jgi:hypothetical protein
MIKIIATVIMLGMLSACGTVKPNIIKTQTIVVMPSESQLRCPDLPVVPSNIETMTDVDVADYILELYKAGRICKGSLEGVKEFLLEAQKITLETNKNE